LLFTIMYLSSTTICAAAREAATTLLRTIFSGGR
jgi:hypothetical protein